MVMWPPKLKTFSFTSARKPSKTPKAMNRMAVPKAVVKMVSRATDLENRVPWVASSRRAMKKESFKF